MEIGTSDSIWIIYENSPVDSINMMHKNVAALQYDTWYKCRIEYSFPDTALTYFLNDDIVYTQSGPSQPLTRFVMLHYDTLASAGAQGVLP